VVVAAEIAAVIAIAIAAAVGPVGNS